MKRELKFRAWHPLNKEMVYEKKGQNFGYGDYTRSDILKDFEDDNIMQFTGLKDKNGKDIYEGDIVRYNELDGWDKENNKPILSPTDDISFIEFSGHGFWVNAESFGWEGEGLWHWDKLEIIGNIFENPELLIEPVK